MRGVFSYLTGVLVFANMVSLAMALLVHVSIFVTFIKLRMYFSVLMCIQALLPLVEKKLKLELQGDYISNRSQSMIKTLNGH